MTAIKALQKRLDKLEVRPSNESDLVDMVLAALSDQDLELFHEHAILREGGFDEEEIAKMMAEQSTTKFSDYRAKIRLTLSKI